MDKLTYRQKIFVENYLQIWNAAESARRAGYKKAYSQGPRLLRNVEIKAEIERRLKEDAMSADEVLGRLTQQARNEGAGYIDGGTGKLDLPQLVEDGKAHLVKKVYHDQNGRVIVELHDAQAALIQLGRYHKLFTDKSEVEIPTLVRPVQELLDRVWGKANSGNGGNTSD